MSTPLNPSLSLILHTRQVDADSFYTACNGRQFNSIEDAVCQLVYVERAEVIKSEQVSLFVLLINQSTNSILLFIDRPYDIYISHSGLSS